ncbi:MAG TPA: hypothetical protein VIT44_13795 [Cyclobacteriaceae bacterium]
MKRAVRFMVVNVLVLTVVMTSAQTKIDEERMQRDIEIAENIFQTLLRQEFGKRNFFPYEVDGSYMPGYGVTFRLPNDFNTPMGYMMMNNEPNIVYNNGPDGSFSYSISSSDGTATMSVSSDDDNEEGDRTRVKERGRTAPTPKARRNSNKDNDSLRVAYNQKIISASKTFLADYGDLISQLTPEERITITNRGEGNQRFWYGPDVKAPKRTMLSIEASKGDISQFKQGKITHDQLMAKIKTVNTETIDELNPDLELLSSIFDRLYRPDLSKTYYTEGGIYYERLKDFGVIYYMRTVSSSRDDFNRHHIPTLKMEDVDQTTRDKKVKELYPAFEKEVKENILEYGRTLRNLKDEEVLVFNITITKCEKCGIPSSLEVTVKNSVLSEYSAGKLTKEAALTKFNVKKGANQ